MYQLVIFAAFATYAFAIPSSLNVQPISRTSVRITWVQNYTPDLKGYTIHYHNGDTRTTEWLTKTIWDGRATEAIIDGLRSEGEYSFCVRSIMTGRVCACSELVHINVATGVVSFDDGRHHQQTGGQVQGGHQQVHHQGGHRQEVHQQGGQQQGGYQQGGQQQGGYQHEVHQQGGQQQGGYQQGGYQHGSHQGGQHQESHQESGHQQGEHHQGGHQHGGHQESHQQGTHQQGDHSATVQLLEAGAVGGDYVQLRWRYDGPKPAKYVITYRGFQEYETADGQEEEQETDLGAPVEVDVENYVAHGLRPDTTYTFEVTVIDKATGRPLSRPQSTRVTTKAYIL